MGHSKELFIGAVDDEFICSICHDVMEDPVMSSACEHVYCTSCILDWNKTSNTCPIDRQNIQDLRHPHRIFFTFYNRMKIHCKFVNSGCTSTVALEEAAQHYISCIHNPDITTPCASDCGAKLKQSELSGHNCASYLKLVVSGLKDELRKYNLEVDEYKGTIAAFEATINNYKATVVDLEQKVLDQDISAATRAFRQRVIGQMNPRMYLDLIAGEELLGRVTIELRADIVPRAAELFRTFCVGSNANGRTYKGVKMWYKDQRMHFKASYRTSLRLGSHLSVGADSLDYEYVNSRNYDGCPGTVFLKMMDEESTCGDFHIVTLERNPCLYAVTCIMVGSIIGGADVIERIKNDSVMENVQQHIALVHDCDQL